MCTKSDFLLSICIALLTGACGLSQAQELNSSEVLDRYRASLSYLESVSMKIVINVDSNDSHLFPQTLDFVFRADMKNNRAEWLGRQLINKKDGELDMFESTFIKDIADGNMYVSLEGDRLVDEGDLSKRVILYYDYKERLKDLLENPNNGGALFGKMYGSSQRSVADLLRESSDFHMPNRKEDINGVTCVVLEGSSKYGKVTAWIAPEKGYNALKWTIEKTPRHLFNNTPVKSNNWQASFSVREFHEVISDGRTTFVPKLAHFIHSIDLRNGPKDIDHYEYETSDIQLNPDFEALGAFKIDLPDGIRVFNRDFPSVRHTWLNGKPVPNFEKYITKEIDKALDEILPDKISSASITVKKSEVVPNEPATPVDTEPEAQQVDIMETQREVPSESHPYPVVLITIGLLIIIISIITWRMFLLKGM